MSDLLSLDLGTTTGWALRTADGRITSGTQSFKPGRFEGGGMRYLRFRRWLTELKGTTEGLGAAVRALGHDPADDNEADALALLEWAKAASLTEKTSNTVVACHAQ